MLDAFLVILPIFSHLRLQRIRAEFHAAEGEPFLAQVLQRGPDMIDRLVDAEEAVAQDRATSKISEKCTFLDDII